MALSHDLIVDRALELVASAGFTKLSMRKLADALGVTPMATYHYFGDREQLLAAMCERIFDSIIERAEMTDGTVQERLVALALLQYETISGYPGLAHVMFAAPVRPQPGAGDGQAPDSLARLIDLYARLLLEGGYAPGDAAQIFHTVMLVTISAIDQAERKTGPGRGRKKPPAHIAQGTPHYAQIYGEFFEFDERTVILSVVEALLARFAPPALLPTER